MGVMMFWQRSLLISGEGHHPDPGNAAAAAGK